MSDRLFEPIGPELSNDDKIARLTAGFDFYWDPPQDWPEGVNYESPELSAEDEATVRGCLTDPSPVVREKAVHVLGTFGPCTWDDLRSWFLDPDKEVRSTVRSDADVPGASGLLCHSNLERFIQLLADAWATYPEDGGPDVMMTMGACMKPQSWLEPTWHAAERLLDVGNADINLSLQCGYFESVIQHFGMGPDDPHIRPWIEGEKQNRKWVLLEIANWLRMKEANLCEIVATLAEDADADIAAGAREVLARKAASDRDKK